MNYFIIFAIFSFTFPLLFVSCMHITTIDDLTLDKDSQIYVGEGEVCLTPYSKLKCQDGLECKLISTTPYVNGVCQKKDYNYEEDFINREENSWGNESLTSEYVEYK